LRLGILVLLGLGVLFVLLRGQEGPSIEPGSCLVLELEGRYVEAPRASLLARVLGEETRPFVGLLAQLALAQRDDRLAHVVLVIRPLEIGWGKAGELRDAIARLRAAGRRTTAYLDLASFSASREFYIATAADEIYVVPGGNVPVIGLAAEYFFLGGMWQKLGVDFEVAKAGRYKSAVESYAGTGMSEASKEMANSLLDSTHEAFVAAVAEGRGLTDEAVRAAIDAGPMLPKELMSLSLVDGVEHLDVLLDRIGGEIVRQSTWARVQPEDVGFEAKAKFALVYGSGTVVQGRAGRSASGRQVFASQTVSEAIHDAAEDEAIDAIILRIDSPGGSALASEQIWRALQEAREHDKPIIASFSDVAASGGYYVAAGADAIVAPGGSLTGSIGVFALRPVLGAALAKIGIRMESLTRGRYADFLLAGEPLSEGARERLQASVLETYGLFLERVAEGRSLPVEQVDAIGQGRVWTGRQAVERGLVDELGGLHEAVALAKRKLGLDEDADAVLVAYPEPRSVGEELSDMLRGSLGGLGLARLGLPEVLQPVESWILDLPAEGPLLVPPVLVEIR
jgi:protease-4